MLSQGAIAKILPIKILCKFTELGERESKNNPKAKKEVNIIPIATSSFSILRCLINNIEIAAKPPETNAPIEKGKPAM